MSAAYPLAAPQYAPEVEPQPRHIEIVSTRAQRRARPRMVYAAVTVAGLFAILIAQLLLSIMVSDGAYKIAALQGVQKELSRDQQTLSEQLHVLQSPQHLAANAESLGMVANTSTAFLRLSDGKVIGKAVAAKATGGSVIGSDGALLIADSLLTSIPLAATKATETSAAQTPGAKGPAVKAAKPATTPGAPVGTKPPGSVASTPQELPAPITR
jgi:hypothetical protein